MKTITVKRTIPAPIEKVFAILADHANYKLLPGVKDSKLIKTGGPSKNGVGAVRYIDAGLARFTEEITRFDEPKRMDYRIIKSFPPLRHEGGSLRLTKKAGGTEVIWTSTIGARVPLVGGLLTPLLAAQLSKAFSHTLAAIEKRLTAN
jgi:uncharacterized protein YndB with AHSA1/START domain